MPPSDPEELPVDGVPGGDDAPTPGEPDAPAAADAPDAEAPVAPEAIDSEELEDEAAAADDEEDPDAEPAKVEEEDDGDPNSPVAELSELRAALDWAFASEPDATPELLDAFANHARMVLEGNRRTNLTAITDPKDVAAKHYLDSWRSTRLLPLLGKRVLDLGSGGGFPGIPIALSEPNTKVFLCESSGKRAAFLRECVEALGAPNLEVIEDRAEEWLARNKVDVVVLRAISSVRENVRLLRKVRHSLLDLVMLKGPSWSREVRAGEREAERLGFRLDTVWEHELPDEMGARAVLVYRAPGGAGM